MSVKMTINESKRYSVSAEQIWKLCGAPGEIENWLPAVEKSWMEGDVRYAELAGGAGQARERVTEHDDAGHYYVYDYLDGPLVLKSFSSRFAVVPTADGGSEILWTAEFAADNESEGTELAGAVTGMYQGGLENIAEVLGSVQS
ncbi:SRPBCC family protein [Rhodococcus oxybenzonivorans]|uniref:SRPBCC family protein n=1 Tax=Rhodococcus oxybenzonivorans TaxID=1990687 RepID=UPI002954F4E3|nr:SRPBCC family protein [Rhodococcus oxybenzonivorans]MDV7353517.1 SRPBCC family protein [Rhodococcus oxybenzonivorans]